MTQVNYELLEALNKDEKVCDRNLYSAGPYWAQKALKTNDQIKIRGIEDFRGYNSGVGTSYCDNVLVDLWNEEVSKINNILKFMVNRVPIFNRLGSFIHRTQNLLIGMHLEKLRIQQDLLEQSDRLKYLLENFTIEDTTRFGCVDYISIQEKKYSLWYLDIMNTIAHISESIDFKEVNSMFEIGGGFGSNVHLMLQNFKKLRKVIYLDIVPNLFVGTEYLRSIYGDAVHDYLTTRTNKQIQFSNDDSLEIYCIASWQIEALDVKVDYFHNARSFVEMPQQVVKNYAQYVEKMLHPTGKIALVSYDNFSEETTFNPENLRFFFNKKFDGTMIPSLINPGRNNYSFVSSTFTG